MFIHLKLKEKDHNTN
jgi:hypothetical protein